MILFNRLGHDPGDTNPVLAVILHAIHDVHVDYPGKDKPWRNAKVVWDSYSLSEVIAPTPDLPQYHAEPKIAAAFTLLFGEDWGDRYYADNPYPDYNTFTQREVRDTTGKVLMDPECPSHVWTLEMSWTEHMETWAALIASVRMVPGGDDSTYDYWPSEFGCAVAYARDLDKAVGGDTHLTQLREVWDEVCAAKRENPEGSGLLLSKDMEDFEEEVTPRP